MHPQYADDTDFCVKVGRICRGIWTVRIDGPRQMVWVSTRPTAGSNTPRSTGL